MSNTQITNTKLTEEYVDDILDILEALPNPETRIESMFELDKYKEISTNIAPLIWNTFGCISTLIQEIINIYPFLAPPTLNSTQSSRVGLVLCILQGLATHPDTRPNFIKANIIVFLYPFLNINYNAKSCEYLRLTTLGVVSALVCVDDPEILSYLLSTDIFSILARIMESSNELAKTVSTYSFMRIISSDQGLSYVCGNYSRLSYAIVVLGKMVYAISRKPSYRVRKLLKHIIHCYIRILDDLNYGRPLLAKCLPDQLLDEVFIQILGDDEVSKDLLRQVISHISLKSKKNMQQVNPGLYQYSNKLG